MLNRRTLRLKAMQSLFAYKQGLGSNVELSRDYLTEVFSPDLNSMEYQDPALLKDKRERALKVFDAKLGQKTEEEDKEILEAVDKAVALMEERNGKDLRFLKSVMIKDVDFVADLYVSILSLAEEFQRMASLMKGRSYDNFVKNMLIDNLKLSNNYKQAKLDSSLNWASKGGLVKEWFRTMISENDAFMDYLDKISPSFEDDFDILNHIYKKVLFKSEVFNSYMEEIDLHWEENMAIVKSLVLKTFKSASEENPVPELQPLSYNWEEDKEFFIKLFDKTINLDEEFKSIIAKRAKNWDIERLALTDRVILEMAITEMLEFRSIPVKVTINEYIEISKRYSTPKSKQFINGMLDVIAGDLDNQGVLKKSGRGLIDNK